MILHVNVDKMENIYFIREGAISILNGSLLKCVEKVTYFDNSVTSNERDYNMPPAKAWTAIDRLSII